MPRLRQGPSGPQYELDTAADLLDDPGKAQGQTVFVRGYASAADGGEGIFTWTVNGAPGYYTTDHGIVFVPNGGDGSAAWVRNLPEKVITPEMFGAKGDGVTSDLLAVQRAMTGAAAFGAELVVSRTHVADGILTFPSGLRVRGVSAEAALIGLQSLRATGTVGDELTLTAPTLAGAETVPVPTASLAVDDWIRVSSCINANSTDAAEWQLGDRNADVNYLSEFASIKSIDGAGSLTVKGGLLFPYSNVPGGDTDPSITASVARKVTFHEGARIRGLTISTTSSAADGLIELRWCRDFQFEDCVLQTDERHAIVDIEHCLECEIIGCRLIGWPATVNDATANHVEMRSSQRCYIRRCHAERGTAVLDITYRNNDLTYRAGPCIDCYAEDTHGVGGWGEFTAHSGAYRVGFVRCSLRANRSGYGFAMRARAGIIKDCEAVDPISASVQRGFALYEMGAVDGVMSGNYCRGHLDGYNVSTNASALALFALVGNSARVEGNTAEGCTQYGMQLNGYAGTVHNTAVGVVCRDTIVKSCADSAIRVGTYAHGTIIDGLKVYGLAAGKHAVRFGLNTVDLAIRNVVSIDGHATCIGINGGGSPHITDLVTFPAGEVESRLSIDRPVGVFGTVLSGLPTSALAYTRKGYAESVFTPGISYATPGDLSVAYDLQNGWYRISDGILYFSIRIRFTPTFTTASGNLQITGLPAVPVFPVAASIPYAPVIVAFASGLDVDASTRSLGAAVDSGASFIELYQTRDALVVVLVGTGSTPSGGVVELVISGSYPIA